MRKLFNFFALFAIMMVSIKAAAVPARSVAREYTQPDGSTVTLRLVGDEFAHFFLTDDNQIVVSSNGAFYFAQSGQNNCPVASKILASNPQNRTAEASAFLSKVNADAMVSASNARRATRRASLAPRRNRVASVNRAASADWPSGIGLFPDNSYPVTGSPNAVIILVQFPDQKFSLSNAKQYFTDFASKRGFDDAGVVKGTSSAAYKAHGSALDYFEAASNGKFTPNFVVLGPVTLPNNMAYYGANDAYGDDVRPHVMVRDAIQALDATTDFSIFDNDGDGTIDNVYVIYSGLGEANGGSDDTIWPHSWSLNGDSETRGTKVDGKYVDSYACSAELFPLTSATTLADGIGTFCHEFSHVMGLPDLYQTEYTASVVKLTPGAYSLMDQGSYNNNSRTPPTYSIYERNAMGWADIEVLNEGTPMQGTLQHMLTSNKGYAIPTGDNNEFFLLENRQLADWDEYLPGHGMLIWHIDYDDATWTNNAPNNKTQQCIDIVEAGGKADNETATTMRRYPFPGTGNVTSFTSSTTPALKSWAGKAIDVPLTDIKESASGIVTFDICGGIKLDSPVCNYTSSPVESDTPVTITLTKPASASASAVIKYIYMYNDASDMDEGIYTAPITISQSAEMEYWLEDGDQQSAVTTLKIYIGEQAPKTESYTIVYADSSSDSSQALSSSTYTAAVEEGADIATFSSATTVYKGITGLKFGSSKNNGSLNLSIAKDYQLPYTQIIVKAKVYGSDASTVSVNGLTAQSVTSSDLTDYTFDLDGTANLTNLTVTSTKRIYVKSITLSGEKSGGDNPNPDPNPDPDPDPDPDPQPGEETTATFDFTGTEAYGLTLMSGSDSGYPDAGKSCVEGPVTLKLNGNVRWWSNSTSGNHLRFYTGSSLSVSAADTNVTITSVTLNVGKAGDWDRTSYTSKAPSIDFNTTHTKSNTALYGIDVKYIKNTTSIADITTSEEQPEYYNLQGVRVANPGSGIYIEVRAGKARKIVK